MPAWSEGLRRDADVIVVPDGTEIALKEYRGLTERIGCLLAACGEDHFWGFSDYDSEAGEIHEQIVDERKSIIDNF